jgi:hypothetical protein
LTGQRCQEKNAASAKYFSLDFLKRSSYDAAMSKKSEAAKFLGRLGGLKGGKARAMKLTAEERSAIARKGAEIRWGKPQKPAIIGTGPAKEQ